MKKIISWLFILLCVLSFSGAIFVFHQYRTLNHTITTQTKEHLQDLTRSAAGSIDEILHEVMVAADAIANDLTSGALAKDEPLLKQRLVQALENHPHFYGAQIIYEPYRYRNDVRLYAPYYTKGPNNTLLYRPLEKQYDYTTKDWYVEAIANGAGWDEPGFDDAGSTLMVSYHRLFYESDPLTNSKQIAGDVCIDISMDEIKRILQTLDLGPSGFPALTSRNGVYLYHPNTSYVVDGKTILDIAQESDDKTRALLWEKHAKGEQVRAIFDHQSTTTGLSSWLAIEPIAATNWSLQNTFIKNDIPHDIDTLRHQLYWIICFSTVFLCLLLLLLLDFLPEDGTRKYWLVSLAISLLFFVSIGTVWFLALSYEQPRKGKSLAVIDHASLSYLQSSHSSRSLKQHTAQPLYLPTGIFIDSIQLTIDNAVLMTGYIWQKYDPSVPKDISRAITIPAAEDLKISESRYLEPGATEVYRWQFRARIRAKMDHGRYPLDRETLTLKILPKDIHRNIILIPDISSYKLINPTSKPGLSKEAEIPGWTIQKVYFDLVEEKYDTDFGITKTVLQEQPPAIHYNIVIKRNFINAFISNLTPLIVVAIMLFLLLLTTTSNSAIQEKMKTGTAHTLSICSALFVVVIFAHIGVRNRIQVQDIFYLEYFYFIIYAVILGVAVSSILFAMAKNMAIIQYRDNLISKVSYWPSVLGAIFFITVCVFY